MSEPLQEWERRAVETYVRARWKIPLHQSAARYVENFLEHHPRAEAVLSAIRLGYCEGHHAGRNAAPDREEKPQ